MLYISEETPLLQDIDLTDDFWQYYHIGKAHYKPFHEKMKVESEIYFYPSMRAGKWKLFINYCLHKII